MPLLTCKNSFIILQLGTSQQTHKEFFHLQENSALLGVINVFSWNLPHRQSSETQQPGEQLHLHVTMFPDDQPISRIPFLTSLSVAEQFRTLNLHSAKYSLRTPFIVLIPFVSHFFIAHNPGVIVCVHDRLDVQNQGTVGAQQVYSCHVNTRVSVVWKWGSRRSGESSLIESVSCQNGKKRDDQSHVHGLNLLSVIIVCAIFHVSVTLRGFILQSYVVKIEEMTKELSLYVSWLNLMQPIFAKEWNVLSWGSQKFILMCVCYSGFLNIHHDILMLSLVGVEYILYNNMNIFLPQELMAFRVF